MKWISVEKKSNGSVVIDSHLGERVTYWFYTPREAEAEYRAKFGLRFTPLAKIDI